MISLYDTTLKNPATPKQFSFGEALVAEYNCPLKNKMQDAWSHLNYLVYVIEGRKVWHTAHGSYDLRKTRVFVRKGACIVEQFFDTPLCLVIVFLPDDFVWKVLKSRYSPIHTPGKNSTQ